MKLRFLKIVNFRSVQEIELYIDDLHAIVGANNSGKSNILRSLDLLINPSVRRIEEETFWNMNTDNEIRIEAKFEELKREEKEKLNPYLKPDNTFHIARTVNFTPDEDSEEFEDGDINIGRHYLKVVPKYNWLREDKISGKKNKDWWKNKEKLVVNGNSFAEFVGGSKPNVGDWKDFAKAFIDEYLEDDDFKEVWIDNPQGYAGVLKGSLPNFILIPAVKEVTEQAKVTKTSPFGQLIKQLLDNISEAQKEKVKDFLENINNKLNRTGGEKRIDSIQSTEEKLNEVLDSYMSVDLEIEFQSPNFETLLSTPKLYADDGFRNSVENKGHGLQRAIIFSILQSYSELISTEESDYRKTTIFGIEEPEIYMHPQAQKNLRNVFKTLTESKDQIFFSTHSPELLDVTFFDEIIRVESSKEGGSISSKVWQLPVSDMIEDLVERHPHLKEKASTDSIRERYAHAYHPNRSEGFFAKKVILVEGATEQYSLPIYAKGMNLNLDKRNIAVVDCGGKGQLDRLYRIFNELGIPCYVVFDYDKSSTDRESIRCSKSLLKFLNYNQDPPENIIIQDTFTCFPEKYEHHIYDEIADDEIAKLTKEAREFLGLGSDSGKPLVARFIARKLVEKEEPIIPEIIQQVLNKAINVNWDGSCLESQDQNQFEIIDMQG